MGRGVHKRTVDVSVSRLVRASRFELSSKSLLRVPACHKTMQRKERVLLIRLSIQRRVANSFVIADAFLSIGGP